MRRMWAWLEAPAPQRPWWQRLLLPFVGLVMIVVGIIGWILPVVPGAPLAVVGIPVLLAFSRTSEDWARRQLLRWARTCRDLLARAWKKPQ